MNLGTLSAQQPELLQPRLDRLRRHPMPRRIPMRVDPEVEVLPFRGGGAQWLEQRDARDAVLRAPLRDGALHPAERAGLQMSLPSSTRR